MTSKGFTNRTAADVLKIVDCIASETVNFFNFSSLCLLLRN